MSVSTECAEAIGQLHAFPMLCSGIIDVIIKLLPSAAARIF